MCRPGGLQRAAERIFNALAGIQSRLVGWKVHADAGCFVAAGGRADPDDFTCDRNACRIVEQRKNQVDIIAQLIGRVVGTNMPPLFRYGM